MRIFIHIIIFSLLIQACKKPYDDPPIQESKSCLVVECTITNEPPPYTVLISKSVPYNSNLNPPKITGAIITINDDIGNIENVIEYPKHSGIYQTLATGMRGQIGRSYKIKINLQDGKNYESDWEKINASPTIDSIYADPGQVQYLLQEPDGTYYVSTKNGMNLHIDFTPFTDQDYYYKVETNYIQQTEKIIEGALTIYSWSTNTLVFNNGLKASIAEYSGPVKEFFIGFVPEVLIVDSNTITVSDGEIINSSIYSVSKKIYQIFTEENTQGVPSNSIFDPIPTQLSSNLKCVSDTTQTVFGYFAAASVVHRYQFFYLQESNDRYLTYNIDSIPSGLTPYGVDSVGNGTPMPKYWFYTFPTKFK